MTEKFCVVLTFINSINLHHTKFICKFVASKETELHTTNTQKKNEQDKENRRKTV